VTGERNAVNDTKAFSGVLAENNGLQGKSDSAMLLYDDCHSIDSPVWVHLFGIE
jgi:hypothetical protein